MIKMIFRVVFVALFIPGTVRAYATLTLPSHSFLNNSQTFYINRNIIILDIFNNMLI